MAAVRKDIDGLLKLQFKPEFLNRIDEIVLFERLSQSMIESIAGLRLSELASRLTQRGVTLEMEPEATAFIASEGFDQRFGARPLKRAIQALLENPLALKLLSGEIGEGSLVRVSRGEEGLSYKTYPAPAVSDA